MSQALHLKESGGNLLKRQADMTIALGANLTSPFGTPTEILLSALSLLKDRGVVIRHLSPFYSTPAFPEGSGPDFVNAAALVAWPGPVAAFLVLLHEVEAALGRTRTTRWGERTIDLDLISAGDLVLPDQTGQAYWRELPLAQQMQEAPDELILPHPRMQDRAFVLVPLADVAPDWRHPVLNLTVTEMRDALSPADRAAVVKLQ